MSNALERLRSKMAEMEAAPHPSVGTSAWRAHWREARALVEEVAGELTEYRQCAERAEIAQVEANMTAPSVGAEGQGPDTPSESERRLAPRAPVPSAPPAAATGEEPSRPIDNALRRFWLQRLRDETGISRTGHVLEGVVTQSGRVIVEWRPPHSTVGIYKDLAEFRTIQVDSANEIVWLDEEAARSQPAGPPQEPSAEQLAEFFHETYERLAPEHNWETQFVSRKPWRTLPANNKRLMIATAAAVLRWLAARPGAIDGRQPVSPTRLAARLAALICEWIDHYGGGVEDHEDTDALAEFVATRLGGGQ